MLIEVQPRGLTDAVAPLREAAEAVRSVADARRAVLSPLGSAAVVQDALRDFLAAWELVAVGAADDAVRLSLLLQQASERYVAVDGAVAR